MVKILYCQCRGSRFDLCGELRSHMPRSTANDLKNNNKIKFTLKKVITEEEHAHRLPGQPHPSFMPAHRAWGAVLFLL